MVNLFRSFGTVLLLLLVFLFDGLARGEDIDKSALERKAKAALALAGSPKVRVATAPAPRKGGPRTYHDGHDKALADQKPLVVFVGCEPQECKGAICSKVDGNSFGSTTGPAVVIGYPQGQVLFIDTTLGCPADPKALKAAIESASKKIDRPPVKSMPKAPMPETWDIGADKPGCQCGPGCQCAPGDCPSKCPDGFAKAPPVSGAARPSATGPPPIGVAPSDRHEWGQFPNGQWGWRLKSGSGSGVVPQEDYRFVPNPRNPLYVQAPACVGPT